MFYSLLLKHRQVESENYNPALNYSTSDYHHFKPLALTKAYSTSHFPPQTFNGHGRQGSKFTVVSNAAETERSYDPFKASRPQHLTHRNDPAKITIHRPDHGLNHDNSWEQEPSVLNRQDSTAAGEEQTLRPPPRKFATRSSLSSTRSRNSNGQVKASSYKRGVSFTRIHKRVSDARRNSSASNLSTELNGRHSNHTEVTDDGGEFLRPVNNNTPASTRYIRSRKAESMALQPPCPAIKPGRTSQIFIEDVRQHSSSLAKDCDEAFNGGPMASGNAYQKARISSLDSRPLPPPPARTTSVKNELLEARKQAELRKQCGGDDSPRYLDRVVNHIDRLIQPLSSTTSTPDRRVTSDPLDTRYTSRGLPSIHESRGEYTSPRTARGKKALLESQRRIEAREGRVTSAPEPWNMKHRRHPDERLAQSVALVKDSIRVVQPSSPLAGLSPVRPPAPLTIRKKSSQGGPTPIKAVGPASSNPGFGTGEVSLANRHPPVKPDLRQQYGSAGRPENPYELPPIRESKHDDEQHDAATSSSVRKMSGWFKRNSKTEGEDQRLSIASSNASKSANNDVSDPYDRPSNPQPPSPSLEPPKKKAFNLGRIFKKKSKPDMSITSECKYPLSHAPTIMLQLTSSQLTTSLMNRPVFKILSWTPVTRVSTDGTMVETPELDE